MGQKISQEEPEEPEKRVDDAIGNLPWNIDKTPRLWTEKDPKAEKDDRKAEMVEDNQDTQNRLVLLQKQVKKENDIKIKELYDLIKDQINSLKFKKDYIYTNTHGDEITLYNSAVDYLNNQAEPIPYEIRHTLSLSKKYNDRYMFQVLNNIDNYHMKEYDKIQTQIQIQIGGKRNKSKKSKKVKRNKSKHFK
jgi:hypothetical protein